MINSHSSLTPHRGGELDIFKTVHATLHDWRPGSSLAHWHYAQREMFPKNFIGRRNITSRFTYDGVGWNRLEIFASSICGSVKERHSIRQWLLHLRLDAVGCVSAVIFSKGGNGGPLWALGASSWRNCEMQDRHVDYAARGFESSAF